MTILPKNLANAKKSHRKPSSSASSSSAQSAIDHAGGHPSKPKRSERLAMVDRGGGDRLLERVPERAERPHPSSHHLVSKAAVVAPPAPPPPPAPQNLEEPLNSDDENGLEFRDDELEAAFVANMKNVRGFDVKIVKGDGACMFRAVADQIYGDEEMHHDVRRLCMDYVAKNRDHFSQFITEDFNEYLERKRIATEHGNHVELQAISEIFMRPIEVYEYDTQPINTFHPISREANNRQENPPIRLSYHGNVHYNSVVDPYAPTIGVGLGLPGYTPGLADQNLMNEAKKASERQQIEEAMLKDKLKMTDWERTEEELQRQIATESYMEFLRQMDRQSDKKQDDPSGRARSSHNKSPASSRSPGAHVSRAAGGDAAKLRSPTDSSAQQNTSKASSGSSPTKFSLLGSKRGASSPNLPCTSREDQNTYSVPLAKVHRNENSVSMPNIGDSFGSSLNGPSSQLLKPSTSAQKGNVSPTQQPSTSANITAASKQDDDGNRAGTSKETGDEPSRQSMGLYEELLATTTAYGDWGEDSEDTALLAVLAQSQQEYLDQLKNSPRQ